MNYMTTTLTIRLPSRLARDFKAKARAAKTNPGAVLREAAAKYIQSHENGNGLTPMQEHIDARAGSWDGYCSGVELLQKTRP
jgi:hypothetical protein